MRIRVTDGDVYEVKRTHVYNKLSDLSNDVVKLVASKLNMSVEQAAEMPALSLKSADNNDGVFEVIMLTDSKDYIYDTVIEEITREGYYDAREDNVAIISDAEWRNLLK